MIGSIYRIIHLHSNITYIGSTFSEPRKRWQNHKKDFNAYLKDKHSEVAIYPYIKDFGIENFKLILIKSYNVVDRKHLLAMEQLWINKLKPINKQCAFQILVKTRKRQYYTENKEKFKEQYKQYYTANKEKIKKEKSEKIHCECGSIYSRGDKARHFKTKKHLTFISSQ